MKEVNNMNDVVLQSGIWIGAGVLLVFYLKRRRNRKLLP
jgi:hypothetical protein